MALFQTQAIKNLTKPQYYNIEQKTSSQKCSHVINMEIMTFSALWTSLLLTRQLIQPYWLTHSLNMQILHLDQALLWSFREMCLISPWNLWEARSQPGSLLCGASGSVPFRRGLITIKGRLVKAFLKVMSSVPGRGGEWRDGRSLERVAVETVSSVGQCEVRGVILGGDCSWTLVVWGGWGGGSRGVTHTAGRTLHSNGWTHMWPRTHAVSPPAPSLATIPQTLKPPYVRISHFYPLYLQHGSHLSCCTLRIGTYN